MDTSRRNLLSTLTSITEVIFKILFIFTFFVPQPTYCGFFLQNRPVGPSISRDRSNIQSLGLSRDQPSASHVLPPATNPISGLPFGSQPPGGQPPSGKPSSASFPTFSNPQPVNLGGQPHFADQPGSGGFPHFSQPNEENFGFANPINQPFRNEPVRQPSRSDQTRPGSAQDFSQPNEENFGFANPINQPFRNEPVRQPSGSDQTRPGGLSHVSHPSQEVPELTNPNNPPSGSQPPREEPLRDTFGGFEGLVSDDTGIVEPAPVEDPDDRSKSPIYNIWEYAKVVGNRIPPPINARVTTEEKVNDGSPCQWAIINCCHSRDEKRKNSCFEANHCINFWFDIPDPCNDEIKTSVLNHILFQG